MSTLISIYLIVALCFIFVPILLEGALKIAFCALFLPAVPFLVAYENWNKKPIIARMIVVLWGLLYLICIVWSLLYWAF